MVGFDTATDETVVGAIDGAENVFERAHPPEQRPVHSQTLLATVEEAVAELGGWGSVDRIAVGIGPGTFTGIRIGVATAAGLAASAGCQAVGVSTLAALARTIGMTTDRDVMALIDARRGEVFGGLFERTGTELEAPFACGPEQLIDRLRAAGAAGPVPLVAGPGAVRFRDELLRAGFETEPAGSPVHRLAGRSLCELGATATRTGPKTLEPLYLRIPDAQLWLERDGSTPGQRPAQG